jgi:hypothetical protein
MRGLFCGDDKPGRRLAAEALAIELGRELYRVDLSTLVNRYIGETEKNLDQVFDAAKATGAVLLFDEADSLLGRRTGVRDAHDRHANLEVSDLLQRLDDHPGLVILTANRKADLDEAFLRRLEFVVEFPVPRHPVPPGASQLGPLQVRLSRLNYFFGRLLSVDDFRQEQQYQLDSRRRHNQLLHGVGVVSGLQVTVSGAANPRVQVQPGVALDCLGREVAVVDTLEAVLPPGRVLYVSVHYVERLVDEVPVPGALGAEGGMQPGRIEEDAELVLELQDPLAAHPHPRGAWRPCGRDHAVPIGRLRSSGGRWRVDRAYKEPRVPHSKRPAP